MFSAPSHPPAAQPWRKSPQCRYNNKRPLEISPMPNDHFVAKTYLKHFADERGLLHAYRKADAKYFPTRPADICHEPDGDIIPNFLSDPAYLGAFRGAFEPMWNHVVEALKSGGCTNEVKFHVAGYWANLLVCTP